MDEFCPSCGANVGVGTIAIIGCPLCGYEPAGGFDDELIDDDLDDDELDDDDEEDEYDDEWDDDEDDD